MWNADRTLNQTDSLNLIDCHILYMFMLHKNIWNKNDYQNKQSKNMVKYLIINLYILTK